MKKLDVRIENIKSMQGTGLQMGCLLFVTVEEMRRGMFLKNESLMGKPEDVSSGMV